MRDSYKQIYGDGVNDYKYPSMKDGKALKEYGLWKSMIQRCTVGFQKRQPTYKGVGCTDNFKNYSFFYEWCHKQAGFLCKCTGSRYWHLDKDLLVKGNKVYGEDTCVFLPPIINNAIVTQPTAKGCELQGVYWCTDTSYFKSVLRTKERNEFNSEKEAFQAYRVAKEAVIRQIAEQYKSQLDPRAYQALLNYTVEVTD